MGARLGKGRPPDEQPCTPQQQAQSGPQKDATASPAFLSPTADLPGSITASARHDTQPAADGAPTRSKEGSEQVSGPKRATALSLISSVTGGVHQHPAQAETARTSSLDAAVAASEQTCAALRHLDLYPVATPRQAQALEIARHKAYKQLNTERAKKDEPHTAKANSKKADVSLSESGSKHSALDNKSHGWLLPHVNVV